MSRPLLTVLTAPVPRKTARVYATLRRTARAVVKPSAPRPTASPYPGHYGVVRSVVEGLRAIDADFNFNPDRRRDVGRVVYAPANEALRQAADFKRSGIATTLVAGPTNALLPHNCDNILLTPEIDILIVASEWVRDLYASMAPALTPKMRVCPAGVDADYWQPSGNERAARAVVYWKDAPEALGDDVERVLRAAHLEPVRVRYGDYDLQWYRSALSEARLAVFLSTFETQGLALAEAWAMDVPTLVWNPQEPTNWAGGDTFTAESSCPYLTPATGIAWKTIAEMEQAARVVLTRNTAFTPRAWVLANMTDAVCASALYAIMAQASLHR